MGVPLLHPWANRLADFSYEVAAEALRCGAPLPVAR